MPQVTIEQAYQMAVQELRAGRAADAQAICRQILVHQPDHTATLLLCAQLAHEQGQVDEAIQLLRRLMALQPAVAEYPGNLGVVLATAGRLDEAVAAFRQAVALRPDKPEFYFHLAEALHEGGQSDEAIAAYERTLALSPDHAQARWNLGLELMLRGDYLRGLPLHEEAGRARDASAESQYTQPRWDGSDLHHRRILLHSNQGMGDAIQFFRYVPMVRARGGQVILLSYPPLRRLLGSQEGVTQFIGRDQATFGSQWIVEQGAEPLPQFDVHCLLMSLVRIFGTTLESIPAHVPYIVPDASLVEHWRQRLAGEPAAIKVGLVWAGNPNPPSNRKRSTTLAAMAPLADVSGVRFYSLQKGEAAGQARHPPHGMELVDWMQEVSDFADTAALAVNLDLVISIDTSVAHLAGALGLPTWVALPFAADWRWLRQRSDSPWYPTMHLFRQPRIGDWEATMKQIAAELQNFKPRRRD